MCPRMGDNGAAGAVHPHAGHRGRRRRGVRPRDRGMDPEDVMPDRSTNAAWSPHTRPLRSHIHGGREQTGCRAGEGLGVSAQWGQSPVWDDGRW